MNKLTYLIISLISQAFLYINPLYAVEEVWTKNVSDIITDEYGYIECEIETGFDGSCVVETYSNYGKNTYHHWFDSEGNYINHIESIENIDNTYSVGVLRVSSQSLVLKKENGSDAAGYEYFLRFITQNSDSEWFQVDALQTGFGQNVYLGYIKDEVLHVVKVGTSSTTASNSNSSNSGSTTPEPTPDAGTFSGWAYFSSYPWVYNYDNKAWYYMQSTKDGLFAYNYNVSGNGWLKVGGVN